MKNRQNYWNTSISCFHGVFARIEKKIILGGGLSAGLYNSMRCWDFLIFPNLLKFFLKSFGNSRDKLYIRCVLLITTLRFACGERKIWSNIKRTITVAYI